MLVYAGLWTQCGKNGVFKWKPRRLKLDILPFLDFDMSNALALLEQYGFIIKFIQDGEEFGYIPKFLEHQAISHKEREAPGTYPDFPGNVPEKDKNQPRTDPEPIQNSSGSVSDTADIGHRTYDKGHMTKDDGEVDAPAAPPPAKADPLFHKIRESFERIYGNLPDYPREGKAINRIIKLASGDESVVQRMIEAFYRLTKSPDKYWSSQPFLPSVLSAGGIWPRVKLEASKGEVDLSWVDELEQPKQAEVVR